MSGATEATLAELLNVAETTNVNIQRLISLMGSGGGSGGGGGNSPLAAVSTAAKVASAGLTVVKTAAAAVGAGLMGLVSVVKNLWGSLSQTIGNLYQFSVNAANGSAKLSDFYDALKPLPFFIGTLAGIFADIIRYSEGLLKTYQDITKSGASFGGDLYTMATQATRAYLSLEEFRNIVRNNSAIFATMGGNVQNGINQFVNIQNRLMGPGSPYARQLLGLGYTFEEVGELVAGTMASQGTMAKAELQNTNAIIAGTMAYAVELDTLTKLTGKRKEQIDKEVKELLEEQEMQAFLASLPAKAAETARTIVANYTQVWGKDIGPSVRLALQTGLTTPLDQNQRMLSIMTRGRREVELASTAQMFQAGVSAQDIGKRIRQGGQLSYEAYMQTRASLGAIPYVFAAMRNPMLSSTADLAKFGRTVGNVQKAEETAAKKRDEQYKGNAATLAQAELSIRQFGAELFATVANFLRPMTGTLIDLGTRAMNFVREFLANPATKAAIQGIVNWFGQTFTYLRGSGDMGTFFSRIFDILGSVFAIVQPRLMYHLENIFQNLYDFAMDFIKGGPRSRLRKAEEDLAAATERRVVSEKTVNDLLAAAKGNVNNMTTEQRRQYHAAMSEVIQAQNAEQFQQRSIQMLNNVVRELDKKRDEKQATRLAEVDAKTQAALAALKYQSQYGWNNAGRGNSPGRAIGTLGVTGKFWETGPKQVTIGESGPESVVTPEIMREILAASGGANNNNVAEQINQLNKTQGQLVLLMAKIEENTRKTFNATNNLNRNKFSIA